MPTYSSDSFIVGLINNPHDGWIDGTAIVIAILLVAIVTATNNYKKELQFRSLRHDANSMVCARVCCCFGCVVGV